MAWCLISRQGLTHCAASDWNIGDQYADQANCSMNVSIYSCLAASGIRTFCRFKMRLFDEQRASPGQMIDKANRLYTAIYNLVFTICFVSPLGSRSKTNVKYKYLGLGCLTPLERRAITSLWRSSMEPTLAAVTKSFARLIAAS